MSKYNQVRTTAERTEAEGTQPRKRIPFGVPRTKLAVPHELPGFALRWVNDSPGRIFQAQQGGYEFVTTAEMAMNTASVTDVNKALGDKIAILVGTQKSGEPLFAYLMKIREEYRQEDEAELAAKAMRNDQQIKNGNAGGGLDSEEFYVPKHSPIKLQTKKTF